MKLDRHTYEAWLLDRLEGRLSAEQENALDEFLRANPDLFADMDEPMVVQPVSVEFPGREMLRKEFPPQGMPDDHRLDDFLVAEVEGELTEEQLVALGQYLVGRPGARRQRELMQAARIPGERLAFPWKEELKKRQVRVVPLWTRRLAAASILLLMALGAWFLRDTGGRDKQVAELVSVPAAGAAVETGQTPVAEQEGATGVPEEPLVPDAPRAATADRAKPHLVVDPPEGTSTPMPVPVEVEAPVQASDPLMAEHSGTDPAAGPAHTPVEEVMPDIADAEGMVAAGGAVATTSAGQPLGQFVANVARDRVLNTPKREAEVDEQDLLALADKTIGAIVPGSSMGLENTGNGDRLKLRLGRSISLNMGLGR